MSVAGFRSRFRQNLRRTGKTTLLLTCLLANRARAAELSWFAPAECDASGVRAQVEQLAEQALATVEGVDFEVHIERSAGSPWRSSLRTRSSPSGLERVRDLSGASCRAVKDALAVAMAMTISAGQQAALPEQVSPQPSPPVTAQNPPGRPSATPGASRLVGRPAPLPAADADAYSGSAPLRAALAAALVFDLGILPALAPGVELDFTLRVARLRFTALGALFAPQAARLRSTAEGADFSLALAALLGCAELGPGAVRVLGCAGFELGWLSVAAVDVKSLGGSRLAYGPRAELGLCWRIAGDLGLLLRVGGSLPLGRYQFVVDGRDFLHQPSVVSFRSTIGLEYAL